MRSTQSWNHALWSQSSEQNLARSLTEYHTLSTFTSITSTFTSTTSLSVV